MTTSAQFQPKNGVRALFDTIYEVKFSKHTPLTVVLLSIIYTVYRTQHYLFSEFKLDPAVSWVASAFLELLVVATAAATFIALRGAYVAELKGEDAERAQWGVKLAALALVAAFLALLGVAWADAWAITSQAGPALIMTMVQATQMILVFCFIIAADLEEREKLREQYASYTRDRAQQAASECRYCHKPVTANNRARHEASCVANPANQP